jgi:PAS domain S-box-containing protein
LTRKPKLWRDLVIAITGVGVFTAIRILLAPVLGARDAFTTYFPAVMLAGLIAGGRATLTAIVVSGLIVWWAFIPPAGSYLVANLKDLVSLATFLGASGLVGATAVYLRRTLIRLWEAEDVQQRLTDELKQRAAEAHAGEARFRAVAENMPGLVFEADGAGRNTFANSLFQAYCGLSPAALRQDGGEIIHPEDRARVSAAWAEALRTGRSYQAEGRLRRADGAWRWFLMQGSPVKDPEGHVDKWVGVLTDITEQREAAELLRTLLQEVSHRVKNSLTLVSGLLQLQARTLEGAGRDALDEASQRVNAVARVHDQLWRCAGTHDIDLRPFLTELCSAIAASGPRHQTVCRIEPARISTKCAVPLGLLVNELLTNAYKYAYPAGRGGEVRVLGLREANGRYRLAISDRGVGLPRDFDLGKPSESQGMKVVTRLVAQLEGELAANSAEPGAQFTLTFPLEHERKQAPAALH